MLATIEDVDVIRKLVFLDCGEVLPITNFFNAKGEDCDAFEAVVCVAGNDAFGWITVDISGVIGTVH